MSDLKANVIMPSSDYKAICDAVREKTFKSKTFRSGDLAPAIRGITDNITNNVNFYDYDGRVLYSYTVAEAQELTELPELPSHSGLVCQGWNFTLDAIKAYNNPLGVGAVYITDDGSTRIHINITTKDTYFKLLDESSTSFEIDWGDGTTGSTEIGHIYTQVGDYTIRVVAKNGGSIVFSTGIYPDDEYDSQASNNTHIISIQIGNRISHISDNALLRSTRVESITLPVGITSIGQRSFSSCFALKHLTIPNGVTTLSGASFSYCNYLNTISIPNGVTSIENAVFRDDKYLKCVSIPNSVNTISLSCFKNCLSLESVVLPSGLTEIADDMFYECIKLNNISIPHGVTTIGSRAFWHCKSIFDIIIPDTVKTIEPGAFYNCDSLESITIPSSVTTIGAECFNMCYSLRQLTINTPMTSNFGTNIFKDCISLENVVLPTGSKIIPEGTFQHCSGLFNVHIPTGVTGIGKFAFFGCTSLKAMILPSTINSIEVNAFTGCKSLTSLKIPARVTSIGNYAFSNCTSMEYYDFTSFMDIPTLGTNAFQNIPSDCEIRVPASLYGKWIVAKNWSTYASHIVAV